MDRRDLLRNLTMAAAAPAALLAGTETPAEDLTESLRARDLLIVSVLRKVAEDIESEKLSVEDFDVRAHAMEITAPGDRRQNYVATGYCTYIIHVRDREGQKARARTVARYVRRKWTDDAI